jgi:hypothetical protein
VIRRRRWWTTQVTIQSEKFLRLSKESFDRERRSLARRACIPSRKADQNGNPHCRHSIDRSRPKMAPADCRWTRNCYDAFCKTLPKHRAYQYHDLARFSRAVVRDCRGRRPASPRCQRQSLTRCSARMVAASQPPRARSCRTKTISRGQRTLGTAPGSRNCADRDTPRKTGLNLRRVQDSKMRQRKAPLTAGNF